MSGSRSLVGWAVGAASALGVAKVLASSAMVAARSPPVSPSSSPGSGTTTEGVWMEGLLEGFSGRTGALPSACAQVSGMFEGESISLVILLRTESGTGRVGSGSDRDPAWGTDLASAERSTAPTRPSRPVFQQPEDRTDVGGHRDRTG